ncbi:MAG: cytochrome C [Deltaproteobacteria bacterium HGW-Deltaproteobacteria-4]|nr:MAG: cytochrome C [Deltaproteobacteria bacterium HGW-Deltaproteobacteria-4]
MASLSSVILSLFKGIQQSKASRWGALITMGVFPILLGAIILDLLGYVTNAYYGFFIYMILGPVLIFGLVLIFVGLFFFKGSREVQLFTMEYLQEQVSDPLRFARIKKLIVLGVALTVVNIGVFGVLAYSGYHYMESVEFCGQFCHTVMNPEYETYKRSPHSRVPCVECHIGSGAEWFVKSKLSGTRQLVAVALNTYPRPIATPVHGLRPARETCEECHRPELFHGEKLVIREHTLDDEVNSKTNTVLMMKIGSAGDRAVSSHGIHWHVSPENTITYLSDAARQVISEVTLTRGDGTKTVFRSGAKLDSGKGEKSKFEVRTMDCIDCHNRPSHIYLSAEEAIDLKFAEGKIPRDLPFIKREALKAANKSYKSAAAAKIGIAADLQAFYQQNYPEIVKQKGAQFLQSITGVQAAYGENVFPDMNIGWGNYTSLLQHGPDFDKGCFRCHSGEHESDTGEIISSDCDNCHTILAEGEKNPAILKIIRGE